MFGYRHHKNGQPLLTIWQHEYPPYNTYQPVETTITLTNTQLTDPVLVDLLNGNVYEIPARQINRSGNRIRLTGIPVPDYPIIITSRSTIL